jgi:hypothetical protein
MFGRWVRDNAEQDPIKTKSINVRLTRENKNSLNIQGQPNFAMTNEQHLDDSGTSFFPEQFISVFQFAPRILNGGVM